jgi:hypothetical protein
MEDTLEKLLTSVPDLGVLVLVVIIFLKHIAKHDEVIKGLTDQHIEERKHQRDVIERNTLAAALNTAALNNVAHLLTKQSDRKHE